MLVDALSQPSIGLSQKEKQVSQEHSKYLIHLLCAVYDFKIAIIDVTLQEKSSKAIHLSVLARTFSNRLLPSLALDGSVLLLPSPSLLKTL